MSVEIKFDSHKFKSWHNAVERQQLPYATALGLTRAGYDVRDAVRANVRKKFTLRNTWTEKGIISTKAEKSAYPNCTIQVGSRDWYMADHETGKARLPKRHKNFALPKAVRPDKKKRITPSKRPGALLTKANAFIRPLKNKGGKAGIFLRKRKGIVLQYVLTPKPVQLPKREFIHKTAANLGPKRIQLQFNRAFEHAIKTAR